MTSGSGLTGPGCSTDAADDIQLLSVTPDRVVLQVAGVRRAFDVAAYPAAAGAPGLVCVDSSLGPVTLVPEPRFTDPAAQLTAGSLLAPMPGTVARIVAAVGDQVRAGQPLLYLEAMKMEHAISAPVAGAVAELPVAPGPAGGSRQRARRGQARGGVRIEATP